MKWVRIIFVPLLALAAASCNVGPDYHTPRAAMPSNFSAGPATQQSTAQTVDLTQWWKTFNDPELNSLIERAVAANFDLEIALTRLQEARTMEVVVTGTALPELDAAGAAGRGTGTNSTKGRIPGPLNAGTNTTGLTEITQVVGFDAGWELDLWGKYRREIEAARDDSQVAAEVRNAALISVISDVARAYMDIRALQNRLRIANDNVRIEQQSVDLVQGIFNSGITNELDLALAKRQLATLKSEIEPLQSQITASQERLAVLLGKYPQDLAVELSQPGLLPVLRDRIGAGLPVDLLRRRPDIRQAERELASSTAQIGVQTADLFPSLAVTAGAGLQGQGLGRRSEGNKFIWSGGPEAYWPLLDFGTLDGLIQIQNLKAHEALVNYKKMIVSAVEEVDDAIDSYASEQSRLENLADALTAGERAMELANQRYDVGLTDFLNVTDAQRQVYQLQDQIAVAQEAAVLQFIALYKGMGGGWERYQSVPSVPKPLPAILATFRPSTSPEDSQK